MERVANTLATTVDAGRRILAGDITEPRSSSAANGWRGVMLEFFKGPADFTAIFANHGIKVHLNGRVQLHQRFEGRVSNTEMRRGSITVSPAGIPKTIQHNGGGDFLVIHIAPGLLLQIADQAKSVNPGSLELVHNFCVRDRHIEALAHQLWDEFRTADLGSGICAEALAHQLCVRLLRKYSNFGRVAQPPPLTLSKKALSLATDYIEGNLASDLTIEEIARALSMSAGHFSHAFKGATGVAPHHYVIERRIEFAKTLLLETDLPIATIASRAGFSTHAHFCTTFRRLTAISPSVFRRKL